MPNNSNITTISEAEFLANESRRLREFAGLIRLSGRTPEDIASVCRLDKRTVERALNGLPLKSDATERIIYYIKKNFMLNGE